MNEIFIYEGVDRYDDIDQIDYIHGRYYYYDETFSSAYGPYDTENDAEVALELYCSWLNRSKE